MRVRSYVERGADLTSYRTFGWEATASQTTGDPRLDNNPFFHERVYADVDKALAARGYEKVPSGTPDLLLHFHASVNQELDLNGVDQRYACEDCRPFVYEKGTLLLDVVDARTNRLLWRGWSEGSIDGMIDDQEWMEQRIDEAIGQILDKFPSRS
jgi:hypothetical protein